MTMIRRACGCYERASLHAFEVKTGSCGYGYTLADQMKSTKCYEHSVTERDAYERLNKSMAEEGERMRKYYASEEYLKSDQHRYRHRQF